MSAVPHPAIARRLIRVRGIVQGVGFRPFVFNLAARLGVRGFVLNTSSGVTIEAEAAEDSLDRFVAALERDAPPLAHIEDIAVAELEAAGYGEFEIRQSRPEPGEFALVSPDTSTCDDCRHEVADPHDRRHGYPFTNCTNCGPRYTIIRDIPYDRPWTTMASFQMCANCEREYHDPRDRRFHAQPNACPACGPGLALINAGEDLPGPDAYGAKNSAAVLAEVRRRLRAGEIVAIKGLGGFQLACDAENDEAVRRLRGRKRRSGKPFALMARDLAAVESFCAVTSADRLLLESAERPIAILPRRPGAKLANGIAPGNDTVGVMLPYTPLHALLFGTEPDTPPAFRALVMTSGNFSDEPIVTRNDEAVARLGGIADTLLLHNRDIYMRVDDSVARCFQGSPRLVRRSRGYVPRPIDLGADGPELLACGAELKNAFCLTKGRWAILSQHIGDVENYETLAFFEETLANLKKLFRVEPQAVAFDLHPLYLTSQLARRLPLRQIGVQHHHAHIASCMAENQLTGKVIGVAFDGTGYGTDGRIWGGEFLVADSRGFERAAHLRYVPLAGGDAAVRQPWRSALGWLGAAFGSEAAAALDLFPQVPGREQALVARMIERRLNTVLTSSCGRLFDTVAALIGLRHEVTFEGQAAIELEMVARAGGEGEYDFEISAGEPAEIDLRPMIRQIVDDVRARIGRPTIAARFHHTLASATAEVCRLIRVREALHRVCLSGGVFQNLLLLELTVRRLRRMNFDVFLHAHVPPNDGGIALGQAAIARAVLDSGA